MRRGRWEHSSTLDRDPTVGPIESLTGERRTGRGQELRTGACLGHCSRLSGTVRPAEIGGLVFSELPDSRAQPRPRARPGPAQPISQSTSKISGNTTRTAVIKTNPGYAPDPSQPGTGTVVAVLSC
jgi:hypothetical protein